VALKSDACSGLAPSQSNIGTPNARSKAGFAGLCRIEEIVEAARKQIPAENQRRRVARRTGFENGTKWLQREATLRVLGEEPQARHRSQNAKERRRVGSRAAR
jgi:hypothetical protein